MNRSHDAQGFALLESVTILFCLVNDGYRNINPNAQRYESLKKPSDSVFGARSRRIENARKPRLWGTFHARKEVKGFTRTGRSLEEGRRPVVLGGVYSGASYCAVASLGVFEEWALRLSSATSRTSSSSLASWAMFHTCAIITGQKMSTVIAVGTAC